MNFQRQSRENLEISITPMIDVVFLLLIFFMVTTTFDRESRLKIRLPEAAGEQQKADDALDIAIDADGNYFVNQFQVVSRELATLKKAIANAAGDGQRPPVVINADSNAQHQYVIRVLDAAQQLGFVHITYATKTPSQ